MTAAGALDRYVALFRSGKYFEAHEALEGLWRARDGDPFLQGLIVLAAAHVKLQRGSPHGARAHFASARRYLEAYAPAREGFDVAGLIAHAEHSLAALAAGRPVPAPVMCRAPVPQPAPPPPATDAEVLQVLREVAAGGAAGEPQLGNPVSEAMLRLRGRAGRSRVHRLYLGERR